MEAERGGALAAGMGAFLVAFPVYMLMAGFGGGVSWSERWTFDQQGRLELEGVFLMVALVVAVVLAAPLGAASGIQLTHRKRPLLTALLTAIFAVVLVSLVLGIVPSGPDDPVIVPYLVWFSIFLAGVLARLLTRRASAVPTGSVTEQPGSGRS